MKEHIVRVEHLLARELSTIIREEFDAPQGTLISITKTEVSQDTMYANVSVSIWPDEKRDMVFKMLQRAEGHLYSFLEKRMRVHPIPKLHFVLDQSIAQASKVYSLMSDETREQKPDTDAGIAPEQKGR